MISFILSLIFALEVRPDCKRIHGKIYCGHNCHYKTNHGVICGYNCKGFRGKYYCSDHPEKTCQFLSGKVYCGANCRQSKGKVYCTDRSYERCRRIAGKMHCGKECQSFINQGIYCDGKKSLGVSYSLPAEPTQLAKASD